MHENHEFNMLSRQEYIDIVVEQLRYIKPEIVIERLTGDGKIDDLIAPLWSIKKVTILNDIDKKMKELDIYQGDLYKIAQFSWTIFLHYYYTSFFKLFCLKFVSNLSQKTLTYYSWLVFLHHTYSVSIRP